ncbi:MAG: carboxypeptidase-like regulatory domain-containing protein [Bacteroidetes bacterium]|nr:carboxypeptidase-like regulatory domain-containing protein [Bacteroidota bacterium]
MNRLFIFLLLLGSSITAISQKDSKLVQFSGYTLTADSLMGVPFAHITLLNRGRVATAGPDGFFSFAAMEGDTLYFTSIGFRPSVYIIPSKLDNQKFSIIQLMTRSEVYLRETIIMPWRREDFHQVFLDTHPPEDDLDRARRNLDRERLAELGETLEADGREAGVRNLRNASAKKYYYGQTAPQNIFNPLAWAEFIRAWKRGDFKKKD